MKYEIGPLFLPPGSVRGLIAIIILGSLPVLLYYKIDVPTFYQLLGATVAGFLFGQNSNRQTNSQNPQEISDMKDSLSKLQRQNDLQKMQIMQGGGTVVIPTDKK